MAFLFCSMSLCVCFVCMLLPKLKGGKNGLFGLQFYCKGVVLQVFVMNAQCKKSVSLAKIWGVKFWCNLYPPSTRGLHLAMLYQKKCAATFWCQNLQGNRTPNATILVRRWTLLEKRYCQALSGYETHWESSYMSPQVFWTKFRCAR